jgi:K+-transporting ATPase ATPase C chain
MQEALDSETRGQGSLRRGWRYIRPSLVMLLALTVLVGIIYPLFVTGIGQAFFRHSAQGSLIVQNGRVVGSSLIGQSFSDPRYFWSRPSATPGVPYNAAASGGSNLSPTNPAQLEAVRDRVAALRAADPSNTAPVPVDLVTASASGLDPDISPAAAEYQVARVARVRGLAAATVQALVQKYTEGRQFGFLGEPRVNVLELNLALDALGK